MSKAVPFDPFQFALHLKKRGGFASDNYQIFQWVGTHWKAIEEAACLRIALSWLAEKTTEIASDAHAKSAYQTALRALDEITEPSEKAVIPLQNGYLHIDGAPTLKPHDEVLGLRHVLTCNYEASAPRPTEFCALLARILPDEEVRARVQEYIGYTLLPDARFQRAQIWIGSGANGKGTLANIVQALHARTAAVQLDRLDGFRLAGVVGASLIYCDEAAQRNINEQMMKSLIAGETIQIDRKYLSPISTRITGKWLILANHIPEVVDQSTGFWRRFDIVPFSVEIPESERDSLLAKRIIDTELTGVLNWAVEGLLRLLARGRFEQLAPPAMQAAVQAARSETNSVQAWLEDVDVEITIAVETSKKKVYENYSRWCRNNGLFSVSAGKFWKRLQDIFGPRLTEARLTTASGRIRVCNLELGG